MRIQIRDPEIFLTLDLGSGMEKIRSGINGSATLPNLYIFFYYEEWGKGSYLQNTLPDLTEVLNPWAAVPALLTSTIPQVE
jgi:hypothetical protein